MYIARQPIFDKRKDVYGYELLFRNSTTSIAYTGTSAESSTAVVLGGLFELGVEKIVGNKKAFVNFNYNSLLSNSIELVDPSTLIIEVLEDVKVDSRLIRRLESLHKEGYRIALDDFVHSIKDFKIVPVADIIKYDLIATPLNTIQDEVKEALNRKKVLLAEKVETEEEFIEARKMGFHLFQGYFFSKPVIVAGLKGKKPNITIYRRILNELHSEDPSFHILAEILETDVSVAYRLLNIVSKKDDNIQKGLKSALIKMGLTDFERWVHIMMLQDLSVNKPNELIRTALIRSKFGELVANNCGSLYPRSSEISLMCLFSVLDAMLDLTMEEAMKDLSISDDIKDALINGKGALVPILKLAEAYEQGQWMDIDLLSKQLQIDSNRLVDWYMDSITWTDKIMTGV
ncbi:MAG: EAL and HDOD domain-containing protein [Catonella sp.]|uniref:EAL and HDOD domain-containing protein n=1 Tax=Catonella sp. TaxID=2382125 RepID=UPI003FA0772B